MRNHQGTVAGQQKDSTPVRSQVTNDKLHINSCINCLSERSLPRQSTKMPVLSRIAAVWLLMLPLVAVDASPFENGSSVIGSDSNWGSKDLSPNLLVDCHACWIYLS